MVWGLEGGTEMKLNSHSCSFPEALTPQMERVVKIKAVRSWRFIRVLLPHFFYCRTVQWAGAWRVVVVRMAARQEGS